MRRGCPLSPDHATTFTIMIVPVFD
jgi:hypothetical protein